MTDFRVLQIICTYRGNDLYSHTMNHILCPVEVIDEEHRFCNDNCATLDVAITLRLEMKWSDYIDSDFCFSIELMGWNSRVSNSCWRLNNPGWVYVLRHHEWPSWSACIWQSFGYESSLDEINPQKPNSGGEGFSEVCYKITIPRVSWEKLSQRWNLWANLKVGSNGNIFFVLP